VAEKTEKKAKADDPKPSSTIECIFKGSTIKENGELRIVFEAPESEIAASTRLLLLKGKDISVSIASDGAPPLKFIATMNSIKFDKDASSRIEFVVEANNLDVPVATIGALAHQALTIKYK
jgi:hypothetical protein